jgi:branched-chain amino acid transport system substrate-binding protein
VALLPRTIGGLNARYIALDSHTDATQSTTNTRKLVTDDHVDVLIGEATTPASLAMVPVAAESKTPMIGTTAIAALVQPVDAVHRWIFKVVPNDDVTAGALPQYMVAHGIKKLGVIGFNDAYLQVWLGLFKKLLPPVGITVVDVESFERAATSTVPQALKLIAAKPDAIFVAAGGTPGVTPIRDLRQHGFKGPILGGHGFGLSQVIDRGGKSVEGLVLVGEPFIIRNDLPADSPFRKIAESFVPAYKAKYGVEPPIMAAHMIDAVTLLQLVVPDALKRAQPGTAEFRAALRDGLEHLTDVHLNNGLLSTSPTNHADFDPKGVFIITVHDGAFHLVK